MTLPTHTNALPIQVGSLLGSRACFQGPRQIACPGFVGQPPQTWTYQTPGLGGGSPYWQQAGAPPPGAQVGNPGAGPNNTNPTPNSDIVLGTPTEGAETLEGPNAGGPISSDPADQPSYTSGDTTCPSGYADETGECLDGPTQGEGATQGEADDEGGSSPSRFVGFALLAVGGLALVGALTKKRGR